MSKKKPDQYAVLGANPRAFHGLKKAAPVVSSVAKRHFVSRALKTIGAVLTLVFGLSACANSFGFGATIWQEEALQHDGSKIVVTRSVSRGGRHEVGQNPPISNQSLNFVLPGTNVNVTWEDRYSEDLGRANFHLRLLEVFNGTPYVLTSPTGCLSYNKWGRPNPPYVIFEYDGKEWQRIALTQLPSEIKMPNLISSSPDTEVKKYGTRYITSEMVKKSNAGYKQPEYRSILREAIENAGGSGCGEMVGNGKGAWEGIGWFKRQPSLEACIRYCTRRDFSAQYCPCNTLFEGK